jgi:hypothetical protein
LGTDLTKLTLQLGSAGQPVFFYHHYLVADIAQNRNTIFSRDADTREQTMRWRITQLV